jgi:hypothetical protein
MTLLARKLLIYVAYSAAVTALPILAYAPKPSFVPTLNAPACPCAADECPCNVNANEEQQADDSSPTAARECPWWCRGPVRRGVRAVALFIARPWRR